MTYDGHDELPLPQFEDRLWERLDGLYRQRCAGTTSSPSPARAMRRGRGSRLAVAAAAAVLAGIVVVSDRDGRSVVASGGWGSEGDLPTATARGTSPGTAPRPVEPLVPPPPGPTSVPPTPVEGSLASRLARALDAVRGTTIVHTAQDGSERWYDEVTAASRYRSRTPEGRPVRDSGWPVPPAVDDPPFPGAAPPALQVGQCDPGTRLMLDAGGTLRPCDPGARTPQPTHSQRSVDYCRRVYVDEQAPVVVLPGLDYISMYLRTGDMVEDGTQDLDGRPMIKVRNRAGTSVVLIDPVTVLPVRLMSGAGSNSLVVQTYERLPRTPENLALLSPPVPAGFTAAAPGAPPSGCVG